MLKLRGLVFQALVYLEEESPGTLETDDRDSFITLTKCSAGLKIEDSNSTLFDVVTAVTQKLSQLLCVLPH